MVGIPPVKSQNPVSLLISGKEKEGLALTVSVSPSRVEVSSKGDAGYVSVSTEATASTFVPEDPVLPKKAPAAPELPFAIVTTTPSSTRREETSAQAPVDQPPGPPMLAVMMSTYLII